MKEPDKAYQCLGCGRVAVWLTSHSNRVSRDCYTCGTIYVWECLVNKPKEWADLFKVRQKLLGR